MKRPEDHYLDLSPHLRIACNRKEECMKITRRDGDIDSRDNYRPQGNHFPRCSWIPNASPRWSTIVVFSSRTYDKVALPSLDSGIVELCFPLLCCTMVYLTSSSFVAVSWSLKELCVLDVTCVPTGAAALLKVLCFRRVRGMSAGRWQELSRWAVLDTSLLIRCTEGLLERGWSIIKASGDRAKCKIRRRKDRCWYTTFDRDHT